MNKKGGEIVDTYFLIESGLRTLLSMFIGGLIGWERESVHRPAGLRTHMLVAVGSCVTMQIGTYLSTTLALDTDPTRLGAQVISGMGFLGAGTILKEGANIRGVTTAASLWAVACLGLAVGSGAYTIAIIGFVAVILILTVFEHASTRIPSGKSTRFSICLQCHHTKNMIQHLNQLANKYDALIQDLQFMMINEELDEISFNFVTKRSSRKLNTTTLFGEFIQHEDIYSLKMIEY